MNRSYLRTHAKLATVLVSLWVPVGTQGETIGPEADRQSNWSVTGYVGTMTDNTAEELTLPTEWSFESYHFAGVSLAYERPFRDTRWSWGIELQVNGHFGSQELFEFNLPVTVRYRFDRPWVPWLDSVAFGLGVSHMTEVYDLEVETRGASGRDMVHWMIEAEFDTPSDA